MQLKNLTILISSNEPWGDVWYSKHNYANELAKHNRVIFINPVDRWQPAAMAGTLPTLEDVLPGLSVLRYRNVIPALNMPLFRLNNRIVSRSIKSFLYRQGVKPDLLLAFDPFRLYHPALLGVGQAVFFAVDDHLMTTFGERHIYRHVDQIITISEKFNERYAAFHKPILTISHAIAADQFEVTPINSEFSGHGLFVGNVDARLDLAAIRRMADTFPLTPFVFMGPYCLHGNPEADRLFRSGDYPNIHYRNPVPFKELGSHIAAARFCLAPLNIHDPRNAISHHKIFHYLALGKPVFCPVFSEYEPIQHLLYMNNDPNALFAALGSFLIDGEQPGLETGRISFARTKTYETILPQIAAFVSKELNQTR